MTHSLSESLGGGMPETWAVDFLTAAQLPVTYENVRAVTSWEFAESGGGGGMWNPLNTTQGGYAGETNANSVGVKNYLRRLDGIKANAHVIHNGYYPHVVSAFQTGNNAAATIEAIITSPWGTRHIALRNITWPVPGTPTPSTPPIPEDEMPSFPSTTKPPNLFRGAVVDLANKHVTLSNAAECDPSPALIPTNVAWLTCYGGRGAFTVVLANLAEYHFTLP